MTRIYPLLSLPYSDYCADISAVGPKEAFKQHEGSHCHREAVEVIITLPATTMHIGAQLSQQYAREMENNRKMLLRVLSCIQFLT